MKPEDFQQQEKIIHVFFLFINTLSGAREGKRMIQAMVNKVQFLLEDQQNQQNITPVITYVIHINEQNERKRGLQQLKQQTKIRINDPVKKVYAISCGGDGTNSWLVQQIHEYKINFNRIYFANLPIGTGNDFAQNYGFAKQEANVFDDQFKKLKSLLREWIASEQEMLDIWAIKATVQEFGFFQVVNQRKSTKIQSKVFERIFIQYFSIGIDGKVGYTFDKYRTQSRIGNNFMYTVLGLAKMVTPTKSINQMVRELSIVQENSKGFLLLPYKSTTGNRSKIKNLQKSIFNSRSKLRTIFSTQYQQQQRPRRHSLDVAKKEFILNKKYTSLVVLNINSFMAGFRDIWKNSKDFYNIGDQSWTQQSSADGKIQFIGFNSLLGQALQNTFHGFGERLAQDKGPFLIDFRSDPQNSKHRTYMQVDGQFIRVTHPESLLLRKWEGGINGQIRVLRKHF